MAELGVLGLFVAGFIFLVIGFLILKFKSYVSRHFWIMGNMNRPNERTVFVVGLIAILGGIFMIVRGLYLYFGGAFI